MRWPRRNVMIGASAAVAAIGLVAAIIAVLLPGPAAPVRPASDVPRQLFSPFTGEPVPSLGPVLAVKIDNLAPARPQTGLTGADLVYVIPVEGGLSRVLAVFSSHVPAVIGPVRGYFRAPGRAAPHNLYAHSSQLLAQAPGASKARDIGFRFGPAPAGGRPVAAFSVSYPAASFTFRWSARDGRWLVWMDGKPTRAAEGGQLSAPTVVIQYTKIRTSRYLEAGARPPYAESTGTGTGLVLRDGRAYDIRWSRADADGGTTFTTASGQPMTFARGPVWVVLAAAP
jgi:DUF3048 family protein